MAVNEGSFTAHISPAILKQIKVREEKFGKSVKTDEELEVIHGNCPWVVLRSGINAPVDSADRYVVGKSRSEIPCSDKAARQNVLGGELQIRETENIRPSGIETGPDTHLSSAYRISTFQGHRSIPGITGVTIRTLDTWGMILEAVVNIKVWSVDDLEALDLVYFKPGFPAILEWGHTLYFDEDGQVQRNPRLFISDEEFFGNDPKPYLSLDAKILECRKRTSNQDAMFGYITNFSYSLQSDGSYDCTVKILSKGSVLESLKIKGTANYVQNANEVQADKTSYGDRSVWHKMLLAFDLYAQQKEGDDNYQGKTVSAIGAKEDTPENRMYLPPRKARTTSKTFFNGKLAFTNAKVTFDDPHEEYQPFNNVNCADFAVCMVNLTVKPNFWSRRKEATQYYVTLRTLLYLFNLFNSNGLVGFDLWSEATYLDLKKEYAVSLNPYVAVKGKQGSSEAGYGISDDMLGLIKDESVPDTMNWSHILNIWINFNQFVECIDNQLYEEAHIIDAIRDMLSRVQKAFGNINDFQIVPNQLYGGSLLEIIDAKSISILQDGGDLPGVIQVTGLNNTVRSLTIESDVSPDLANQVCIAAQAPKDSEDGSESVDESLVHWGENCISRYTLEGGPKTENSSTSSLSNTAEERAKYVKRKNQWEEKLQEKYVKFNDGKVKGAGENTVAEQVAALAESEFQDEQLTGEEFLNNDVRDRFENTLQLSHLQGGIIPIRAGMTLMGLGRLTIGTTFRVISGVIPTKYKSWGWIVTGIDHTISQSGWETKLKTQYYPIYHTSVRSNSPSLSMTDQEDQSYTEGGKLIKSTTTKKKWWQRSMGDPNSTKFMECFRAYGGTNKHKCLRYTSAMARGFVRGREQVQRDTLNGQVRTGLSGGENPMDSGSWTMLRSYGYSESGTQKLTKQEIIAKLQNSAAFSPGDVVMYWSEDKAKYHAQMYQGNGVWQTDDDGNFGTAFVYRSYGCNTWYYKHFKNPGMSSDWTSIA